MRTSQTPQPRLGVMPSYRQNRLLSLLLCLWLVQTSLALVPRVPRASNPIIEGWYADPEAHVFENEYWIYPTTSTGHGRQTAFEAFSSKDLVSWKNRGVILDFKDVPWSTYRAAWAPSVASKNGKYYLYFSAGAGVGIGVAVSDSPAGPFKDALDKPLISEHHFGAEPIDAMVFIDDDGRNYLYWGGMFEAAVVELEDDMITLKGDMKHITPPNYTEAPFMLKRHGVYYLSYSSGVFTNSSYAVEYVTGFSPMGPFLPIATKILETDDEMGDGPGHHSILRRDDDYYMVYHRRTPGETTPSNRVLCIDMMYFNLLGGIDPVEMTNEGVKARPLGK